MQTILRRQWRTLAMAAAMMVGFGGVSEAAVQEVMCLKTNSGQYIEVARVSMMAVADGASTFEIVVKDGEGATGVESISFEKHETDIDVTKYSGSSSSGSSTIDTSKPVYLFTSTGKYFYLKDLPTMTAKEGSTAFDVTVGSTVESDVAYVWFYRGVIDESSNALKTVGGEEKLKMVTPVSSQLQLSGCGSATRAIVVGINGATVAEAPVRDGVTTLNVGHLPSGMYIVSVGNKALSFVKK